MKKFLTIFAVAALSLAAVVSCSKDKEQEEEVIALKGISLNTTSLDLFVGDTGTLTVTLDPANPTEKPTIAWSSSNEEVATVSADGVVTAVAVGESTITASAAKFTATCTVKVSSKDDYEGPVTGESDWSIIGSLTGHEKVNMNWDNDIVMAQDGDIYVVKNLKLAAADEFKIRYQKAWDNNRGGEFAELGTGFDVTNGGANIKPGLDGLYDVYYNAAVEQMAVVAKDGTPTWKEIPAGKEMVPFNADDFAALDWSNKDAATWYYFAENYALPEGFTYILHIYPYSLKTSGMRVGNFGNNTESPCNMLRFGQNGDNAELEWMVDTGEGRSQKELLAPGFKTELWQAIVLTADKASGTYKIYRNAELKATKTAAYNDAMGFGAIEFANSWGASWRSAFDGRIALLSVYNKALSEEEIAANIFTTPTSDACVGFWPMNDGEGAILASDKTRAITEDIDLSKAVRNDDDNLTQNYEFDATEYLKWTTGNKIEEETETVLSVSEFIALADDTEATFTGIVATVGSKGVVVTDGTANVYVFSPETTPAAGDEVNVTATKTTYYGLIETKSGAAVEVVSNGNTVTKTETVDITSTFDDYPDTASTSDFVKVTGTVAISGNYTNFNVAGASKRQGSLQGLDLSAYDGKKVDIQGYYIGTSGSGGKYVVIIVTEVTENDEVDLVEGKAPYMKNVMFGATFPEEYASLDNATMEGWVYPKSFSGAQANLPTFMGTENAFLVRFENSKPQIVLGDPVTGGGEIKASSETAFQVNAWYHIAATYTRNGKIVLYVNGEQVAENTTKDYPVTFNSGVNPGANDDAAIGRVFWVGNAYSTRWFDGNMSHIRVWNKALTPEEIKNSANNKALTTADGLIANWPLTEASGATVTDLSGNDFSTTFKTYSSAVEDASDVTREDVTVPDLIFAEALSLDQTALNLMRGDVATLKVTVTPANALTPTITWETSDENIATVSDGTVTAKGAGSATITAKATVAGTELKAECAVTVAPLSGAVAPNMKNNYFRTLGGYGSLDKVTVEWKMKANYDDPVVSSIFGKEGNWLLRVGDAGIGLNQLQLATNHGNWTTQALFDADKWYHVAVTYDSTSGAAQVYVNGELVDSSADFASAAADLTGTEGTSVSYWSNDYSNDVNIGASYFELGGNWGSYYAVNNRWLDGQMCELRVWDIVRTADEIKANMDNLDDTSSSNLKAYYKMNLDDANNGNGNTIKDYSSAAKDLTAAADILWQQGREDIGNAGGSTVAEVGTILWAEDWTGATNKMDMSTYKNEGTTVYNGGTVTYTFVNGGSSTYTYLDNQMNANAEAQPNLLLSKTGGKWIIEGIPTGGAKKATISYNLNNAKELETKCVLTTSTEGVTVSERSLGGESSKPYSASHSITISGVETFTLEFSNTHSSNVRLDDLKVVVAE